MSIVRLVDIDDLANPDSLAQVVGPVQAIEREPMPSAGFSGSRHERLIVRLRSGERRRLVLKRTPLERDWTCYRTGDSLGREAALLKEPALAGVWEVFACPYLA